MPLIVALTYKIRNGQPFALVRSEQSLDHGEDDRPQEQTDLRRLVPMSESPRHDEAHLQQRDKPLSH